MADDTQGEITPSREFSLDEMADLHSRLSFCETADSKLSRRISALEEANRGHFEDDPTKAMVTVIVAIMVLQVVAPLIADWMVAWRKTETA